MLETTEKASKQSIIQEFSILGLYGYRDLTIESATTAKILIAQNGAGKTTLLNALYNTVTRNYGRLRNLEFREIRLKIAGFDRLTLTKEAISGVARTAASAPELVSASVKYDIEPVNLVSFLLDEWSTIEDTDFIDNSTLSKVHHSEGYVRSQTQKSMNALFNLVIGVDDQLSTFDGAIVRAFSEFEIVYLPTYRRLELDLAQDDKYVRRRRRPRLKFARRSIHSGKVEFGLSDIREQLAELNSAIVRRSNIGYRDLTARIINDMIEGRLDRDEAAPERIPDREDLEMFFERLSDSRRVGPYPQISAPNIEKLYSIELENSQSDVFLRYFMDKLTEVIDATKYIERSVDSFISTCNKYLASPDLSVDPSEADWAKNALDAKCLRVDRGTLRVSVESLPTRKRISLDALSSGEKQMVSLFAKMYLYPKPKIVLIDEPELSLSIEWQTHVLEDILLAPDCQQLIAITHSPFVFDNDLEPFAGSLSLHLDFSQDLFDQVFDEEEMIDDEMDDKI